MKNDLTDYILLYLYDHYERVPRREMWGNM